MVKKTKELLIMLSIMDVVENILLKISVAIYGYQIVASAFL